ncbi:MAG TPA: NAD(P)/FAD-dependent oxidoreductase [Rhodocyclaceae bacterium]|nr:NAD(P)/FAD-dependent oxidoreductase [Rhodocyclaceae bacterium]
MKHVVILGAGPAGMSCALWLKNLGCQPLVLERESEAGGLLRHNVLANDWVLGQQGQTGSAMAQQFARHFAASRIAVRYGADLRRIDHDSRGYVLECADGEVLTAAALVVATGTRVNGGEWLASLPGASAVPPERLCVGPAAFGNEARFRGRQVLVVGGGDNAHEFVRFTAAQAAHQIMLVRTARKAQLAQQQAVDALVDAGQVSLYEHTVVSGLEWRDQQLVARLGGSGAPATRLLADMLVVQTGYLPNSEAVLAALDPALRTSLAVDADGYFLTDALGRTRCPGLYAIGDISNRDTPCVVTALAAGASAARDIERSFREQP